jgi:dTDP-4-dehydrorhamnose reductase
VNATAPRILAEEASRAGALLVHYSTDYVFDGTKREPWVEQDPTGPLNVYGASKLEGEQAIQQIGGRFLIFRTSWVYGPRGSNFLLTMLRLGRERELLRIVDDQIGAPTTALALARGTRQIVDRVFDPSEGASPSGVYHMSSGGRVSWCGFARAIFSRSGSMLGGKRPQVEPIESREYPTPARRPQNSVLSNEKLAGRFGVRLPDWETGLDEVIALLPST